MNSTNITDIKNSDRGRILVKVIKLNYDRLLTWLGSRYQKDDEN